MKKKFGWMLCVIVIFGMMFMVRNAVMAAEVDGEGDVVNELQSEEVIDSEETDGVDETVKEEPQVTTNGESSGEIIPDYPSELGFKFENKTIGEIIGGKDGLLSYIYVIAGLILLFMLIAGGLGLMTAAGDPKKMEASQGRITAALIGFLIVFISYFVVQLVELMLNVKIL